MKKDLYCILFDIIFYIVIDALMEHVLPRFIYPQPISNFLLEFEPFIFDLNICTILEDTFSGSLDFRVLCPYLSF